MFKADLHCHTTCSDGADSVEGLIQLATDLNLSGLSITDHDTIAGYPHALALAKKKGIPLLPGVEFSASHCGASVHILAYAFYLQSNEIKALCERHHVRRLNRNHKILQKLKKLGIEIEEDMLGEGEHTLGRPHIAKAMIQKEVVSSIKEAFDHYLGEGKVAYDLGETVSVLETIETIHKAGGKAVIAHPHLIKQSSVILQLLSMPFDGLEGYYARFSSQKEQQWIKIAMEKKWIITGGSDYHGSRKPFNLLGSSWVGKETFYLLYEHYLATNS